MPTRLFRAPDGVRFLSLADGDERISIVAKYRRWRQRDPYWIQGIALRGDEAVSAIQQHRFANCGLLERKRRFDKARQENETADWYKYITSRTT